MNLQTHFSMQAGTQLSSNIDDERQYLRQKICEYLIQRYPQSRGVSRNNMNMIHLAERLEDSLYKASRTKEEYSNLKTLGSRLGLTIRNLTLRNDNQQLQHPNYSSSTSIMIPTPGYQQPENSSMIVTSSLDGSLASNNSSSPTVYSGSFLPTRNGSSENVHECSSGGVLEGGYQQSTASSEGNNMMTSMGGLQQMTSQMISTPRYNNNDVNNNSNNQPFVNTESSDNFGAYPVTESSIISQPMRQNRRILHNLGGPMGGGIRSSLPQKSDELPSGSVNGGLGIMGNNMSLMNSHGTTEGYLTGIIYGNSLKPMLQHVDQNRHSEMQYGVTDVDAPGSGNLNVPVTSDVSIMNNQSLNIVSMATTNNFLVTTQSTAHNSQRLTPMKPQSSDQGCKMNFQLQYSVRENLLQPSHQLQRQAPKKQQNQNQLLLKDNAFSQCQLLSDIASVAKSRSGIEHCCDMQSQFQQNSMEDNSIVTQLLSHPPGPGYQSSDKMQQSLCMKSQQFDANSENYFGGLSCGTQTNATAFHGQWYSKSQDVCCVSRRHLHENNVQNEFPLTLQQTVNVNNLSTEESMVVVPNTSKSSYSPKTSSAACRSGNLDPKLRWKYRIRWLLLLWHAGTCTSLEGQCAESNCVTVKKLWTHMTYCKESQCVYPLCHDSKGLLAHHKQCQNGSCPVCIPVKNFHAKVSARSRSNSVSPSSVNGSCKSIGSAGIGGKPTQKMSPVTTGTQENLQPSKRIKIEQGSQASVSGSGSSVGLPCAVSEPSQSLLNAQNAGQPHESHIPNISETTEMELEPLGSVVQPSPTILKLNEGNLHHTYIQTLEGDSDASTIPSGLCVQEVVMTEKETTQFKPEVMSVHFESVSKSVKPKIKGVSLTELFTSEQVREHIAGLRQWVGQSKAKVEKNQAMEHSMSENSCQLCAVERLTFEPPPLYCTSCGARVKRNVMYYTIAPVLTRYYFCIPCYNETRGDTMPVEGTPISKSKMEKKKNDVETEEWWVQCDKCEAWQHQICTLFNGRRNHGGQAEYTCPNCYIAEVERGERVPLPGSTLLGAKDLPRTILSDHLEQRLVAKLGQERLDRARAQEKHRDEVPAVEPLVIRVVSSVDKKLEVKPRFLEIFQDKNYPVDYPYRSKVVLLFQNIEGVEVCLFGMYVQEFGSECQQPNQRRVYLSYLDSVKYFRPEVKAVTGEALRTFVYHEILIGYLDYCKMRGFTSCYIWACPPLKGEDYILYCHPEIQKTPKSDKLREWYLAMLRKATKENIVVELTNMYDHFFVSTGECRSKVTAARLPYFDGDYWPGAAEDMIFQLQQEEDGTKQSKKGTIKKHIPKRALKAAGQTDLSGNPTKDLMLMHGLGETISRMKEDFIMVHLQHACTHCCTLMVSGNRWVCKQCKKFELCDRCYDAECKRDDRERHPIHHKNKHMLHPVEITGVPEDTKDKDEILESEFFDTRQAFLNLCQGNHYQYDTLRRAKHSSMMVLYHLHNPTAPAFVTTCNICALDVENGQGWCCETCTDYHICDACYQKNGGIIDHPHKLTINPSCDRDAQSKEARKLRVLQLKKMLELLVHASQCRVAHCEDPNCHKVIELFQHGSICKTRASKGCALCKKMWSLIQLHSRSCKLSECHIPRCRDLKEHLRRLQQQSESRRRAAVTEMMHNRAAEVDAGIS